ncbi:hypothetical protein [Psychrobacillus sp. MER TA 171]|uniref:hypothetical protein n=1 Tax=Psychrobacillus sp. MER TA 171 TaxID=2939577 RepID=UPI00203A7BC0|nr:hypothetical protein [Psychrobacillus sp. MER TA 171]MCM3358665.1 hypothetical protein [Psychrobacillus sp. MER TA 171]
MTITRYNRRDEDNLPNFLSHEEARGYFKQKYGDAFIMTDSQEIGGKKLYFYRLILDPQTYKENINELLNKGNIRGIEFLNSYQSIEIFEDGGIHIIH